MPTIAMSYRRSDSQDISDNIYYRLAARYGRDCVFRDLDQIVPGLDFREEIKKHIDKCDVMLVIIGPNWAGTADDGSQRIQDPGDFVRLEVEAGLRKGIPVIPVLVRKAQMPGEATLPGKPDEPAASLKNLAYRHAITVDSGADLDNHINRLIRAIDGHLGVNRTAMLAASGLLAAVTVYRFPFFPTLVDARGGFANWLDYDPMNYPELAFLICLAPVVAYATYKGQAWSRIAGIGVCAFGILDGLHFYPGSKGNTRLLLYAAIYAAALIAYVMLFKGASRARQVAK